MFFALLTFLSAFLIEGIGTYISILGLSALFAFNPIIIVMAVALDVGKLVTVSFVYKYWAKINWLMKTYMSIAAVVLVMITSMGVFGFLSGEFQKAMATSGQQTIKIQALTEEQARLQKRKEQIDKQIAELPSTYSRGRVTVINGFKEETTRINARLAKIDEELPALKIENIEKAVKIGPILYVAEAFNTTPEKAVKWVILTIIFVFDPLAIALLLAGNFLMIQREGKKLPPPPQDPHPTGGLEPVAPKSPAEVPGDGTWVSPITISPEAAAVMDDDPPTQGRTLTAKAEAAAPVAETVSFQGAAVEEEIPPPRKTQQLTIETKADGPDLVKREVPSTKFDQVNGTRADVYVEDDRRRIISTQELVNKYRSDVPGVSVGGPFKR